MNINVGNKGLDNFKTSKTYEDSLDNDTKKQYGVYYTPEFVVKYITHKTLKKHDIIKNPCPKVLDISCGCGNFLLEAYDILYDLIDENIYDIKDVHGEDYINRDNIHNHIVENCIYGADIDKNAIEVLRNSLIDKDEALSVDKFNLYCLDSLFYEFDTKFDYIIGNPPYIGQKKLDNNYKKALLDKYSDVYKDKSDLYYCFYKKIIESIKEDGTISIITPRYFLESPSGGNLRDYIQHNINVVEILDFLGCRVFKNIGISSCIVTLKKSETNQSTRVLKILDENIKLEKDKKQIQELIDENKFEKIQININLLNKDWLLSNESDRKFIETINRNCEYRLEDIATSFQGIITGCDKAFIVNKYDECTKSTDKKLLKRWIKNKDIEKYIINESDKLLIYSNDIDENKKSFVIDRIISNYKEKLMNRRECKKNIRKWYELQWGREKYLFERKKIMYPYKCSENRFAIDYDNSFCSADVYSFYIKDEYIENISYEYLVGILNSDVYNKYFKLIAKKLGRGIYDYYPNKVMKIKIYKDDTYEEIERLSKEIINKLKLDKSTDISSLQIEIDKLVRKSLNVQSLM